MGCWNGTCGLTNMPIMYGDKVVLFILRYNGFGNESDDTHSGAGITYANDIYTPITIPIYGTYDDYGGIEDISKNGKEAYDHFIDFILKSSYRGAIINEEEFERQGFSENEFPKNIYELINDYIGRNVYSNMGYVMVLEDVLDKIKINKQKKIAEIKKDSDVFIESYKQAKEDEDRYFFDYEFLPNVGYGNKFSRFWDVSNGFSGFKYPFVDKLYAMEIEERNNMIESLIDLMIVDNILKETRKFWTIQSGNGSQDLNYDDLALLSNIILERKLEFEKRYQDGLW